MRSLSCLAFLVLCSCATTVHVPERVYVKVPVYCTPPIPAAPVLPVGQITAQASDAAVARAYVESLLLLRSDDQSMRRLLQACANHPRGTP